MLDPVVATALSLTFALLFGAGAWDKLGRPAEFRGVLADYRLLPPASVRATAVVIGLLELVLAMAWLAGRWPLWVAAATAALLLTYASAMAINLWRGRRDLSCGCVFGAAHAGNRLSWALVVRNLVLTVLALIPALPATAREPAWADHAVATVAAMTLVLLYLAAQQLLGNAAAIRAWYEGERT